MTENRIAFSVALLERFLLDQGLDIATARFVESGLRTGRNAQTRPPLAMQQPERYYPGLTSRPWYSTDSFPWVPALESAYHDILAEGLSLRDEQQFQRNPVSGHLADGAWREVRLISQGFLHTSNCAACPHTMRAISAIRGASSAGLVYFATTEPGTHIKPHFGPHNARLRCHLGLIVPGNCSIRVGDETRTWEAGRALIFDDSFEHEVWNHGEGTRMVLSLDIWHPDLSPTQIASIQYAESRFVELAYEIAHAWVTTGSVPIHAGSQ